MKKIILTTPDEYFEKSFQKTMDSATAVRRRRRTLIYSCAAIVLAAGTCASIRNVKVSRDEKEYLAQQAEMAKLDIFLEVNR